ncbi:hypothetical protein A374_17749 [Fictibacillus macauensis ZFHKF-1]|uniref:DUF3311 domain-containing protein n=1 Tax=Fictibacillus macauensis ZFHKF-1 TaxID=1196324 RepID=I8UAS0_9BACL|nr:DUF3311 domain-containing protein [Fictibacillus macauensis]EIT83903.1 hypothetical protein A374_17749 [Fictibacillus macauensis ZFHKF-1]
MKGIHWLALLPFVGLFGGLGFANKVEPYVAGMPFIMFWVVMWVVLTSVVMACVYKLDPANKEGADE